MSQGQIIPEKLYSCRTAAQYMEDVRTTRKAADVSEGNGGTDWVLSRRAVSPLQLLFYLVILDNQLAGCRVTPCDHTLTASALVFPYDRRWRFPSLSTHRLP